MTTVTTATIREADIYQEVLKRYTGTPAENSFPDRTFKTVYVVDKAYPGIADPHNEKKNGVPISPEAQAQIVADLATVKFISDGDSVLDHSNGCAVVKDDGILITLGTVEGTELEVKVGVFGFVACLGATWLTYVVENPTGTGWTVKGTTGSMAIA